MSSSTVRIPSSSPSDRSHSESHRYYRTSAQRVNALLSAAAGSPSSAGGVGRSALGGHRSSQPPELAAIERERWRRATAPLTATDYERALDQLQSSSDDGGFDVWERNNQAVRYLHMVGPHRDDETSPPLQHVAAAPAGRYYSTSQDHTVDAASDGSEEDGPPIVYRAGVDLLERLMRVEGSLRRSGSAAGSADDDDEDNTGEGGTEVMYVGVAGGRAPCVPLISPQHPAHAHREKSQQRTHQYSSSPDGGSHCLVVNEKTHFYNTAAPTGGNDHDVAPPVAPGAGGAVSLSPSRSSHQSRTSDAAIDTGDLPWSEQFVRLHDYVTTSADAATETAAVPAPPRTSEAAVGGDDDNVAGTVGSTAGAVQVGVVVRTSSSPNRRDASNSPLRWTTPPRGAVATHAGDGGDSRENRAGTTEEEADAAAAAAEAAARARARQSWELRPRPLPVPTEEDKLQLERWQQRQQATSAAPAAPAAGSSHPVTPPSAPAAPVAPAADDARATMTAANADSPVSDVSDNTQALIDERARKAREELDELINRLCAIDQRDAQRGQERDRPPVDPDRRSDSTTPDNLPTSNGQPNLATGGSAATPPRAAVDAEEPDRTAYYSPDDAEYYDSLHARREEDLLRRDYLNFSKEVEHETSGVTYAPPVAQQVAGAATPTQPPVSSSAAVGPETTGRVPFWSPTHERAELSSSTSGQPNAPPPPPPRSTHDQDSHLSPSGVPAVPLPSSPPRQSDVPTGPQHFLAQGSLERTPASPDPLRVNPISPSAAAAEGLVGRDRVSALVARAKHVDPFTAFEEFIDACTDFSISLRQARSKLPLDTFDSVRSVLGFSLSFSKASQALYAHVASKGELDFSSCSPAIEDKDMSPEEPLVMIDQLVREEVDTLSKALMERRRQLQSVQSSVNVLKVLAANPRLSAENAVQLPKLDRDIIARRFVLDQTITKGQYAEIQLALLGALLAAYPQAYVSSQAKVLLSSVVMRMMDRYSNVIVTDSGFSAPFPAGDECVRLHAAGSLRAVQETCARRCDVGRRMALDASSSSSSSSIFDGGDGFSARFPFVRSMTSPSQLLSGATTDEAQLIRLISRSHNECETITNRSAEFAQRPQDFTSLTSLAQAARRDFIDVCFEYDDVVADLCDLVEHRCALMDVATEYTGLRELDAKANQNRRGPPTAADNVADRMLQQLISQSAALEAQVLSNDDYYQKRLSLSKVISAELDLVRRLDQVPIELPPLLFTHGITGQQKILSDLQRRKFSAAVTRAQLFVDAVKCNGAVARSLILLIGNCMMKPASRRDEASTTIAVAAIASLKNLHSSTEVLASSIRREKLAAAAGTDVEGASPIMREVSAGSVMSVGPPDAAAAASDERVKLFGPEGPSMKKQAAEVLLQKTRLLVDPGIMVFSEYHPSDDGRGAGTAATSKVSRCTMKLDPQLWELRVTLAEHQHEDGGANNDDSIGGMVMQIAIGDIDMMTQGSSRSIGPTAVQSMRVELTNGTTVEILYPSFASFQEWSEVLVRLVKFKAQLQYFRPFLLPG